MLRNCGHAKKKSPSKQVYVSITDIKRRTHDRNFKQATVSILECDSYFQGRTRHTGRNFFNLFQYSFSD